MSSRFTRNLTEVTDVNKLAEHVTTQNDLVQTTEGDVFVVTKNGYEKITGGDDSGDLDTIKNDVDKSKSEQTKIKNRITPLETFKDEQDTKNSELDTTIADLTSRIEALETPTEE